jgi:FMN hydrolase / 5-amino-6-(5-phospho-D-ribitylamino)uracil phosphatase
VAGGGRGAAPSGLRNDILVCVEFATPAAVESEAMMLKSLRAIAFDLDNTLWEVEPVIERAERCLLEWLQQHYPRITTRYSLEDMRAARARLALEEPHRAHDLTYLRSAALARHAQECGYEEAVGESGLEIFLAARNEVELFDDVQPAIGRLHGRYALATLSNGNADLGRIGLAHWFVLSLNARQIGAAKPHPRCFEHLARNLRVAAGEILFVGDDPRLDVEAARASGFLTAWMNRRAASWPEDLAAPDLEVRSCLELADRLERAPDAQHRG